MHTATHINHKRISPCLHTRTHIHSHTRAHTCWHQHRGTARQAFRMATKAFTEVVESISCRPQEYYAVVSVPLQSHTVPLQPSTTRRYPPSCILQHAPIPSAQPLDRPERVCLVRSIGFGHCGQGSQHVFVGFVHFSGRRRWRI